MAMVDVGHIAAYRPTGGLNAQVSWLGIGGSAAARR